MFDDIDSSELEFVQEIQEVSTVFEEEQSQKISYYPISVADYSIHLYVLPDDWIYTGVVYIKFKTHIEVDTVDINCVFDDLHSVDLHWKEASNKNKERLVIPKQDNEHYILRRNTGKFEVNTYTLEVRFQNSFNSRSISHETKDIFVFSIGEQLTQSLVPLIRHQADGYLKITIDLQGSYLLRSMHLFSINREHCQINGCVRYTMTIPYSFLFEDKRELMVVIRANHSCRLVGNKILFFYCTAISLTEIDEIKELLLKWENEFKLGSSSASFWIVYAYGLVEDHRLDHNYPYIYTSRNLLTERQYFYEITKSFYNNPIRVDAEVDTHWTHHGGDSTYTETAHHRHRHDHDRTQVSWFRSIFRDYMSKTPKESVIYTIKMSDVINWMGVSSLSPHKPNNFYEKWFDDNILMVDVDLDDTNTQLRIRLVGFHKSDGTMFEGSSDTPPMKIVAQTFVDGNAKSKEFTVGCYVAMPYEHQLIAAYSPRRPFIVKYSQRYLDRITRVIEFKDMSREHRFGIQKDAFLMAHLTKKEEYIKYLKGLLKMYHAEKDTSVILDICNNIIELQKVYPSITSMKSFIENELPYNLKLDTGKETSYLEICGLFASRKEHHVEEYSEE